MCDSLDQPVVQVVVPMMYVMPYGRQMSQCMPAYGQMWERSLYARGAVSDGKLQKLPSPRKLRKSKRKEAASETKPQTKIPPVAKDENALCLMPEASELDVQADGFKDVAARETKVSAAVAYAADKANASGTTMMICDLPCRINRAMLTEAIDSIGFADTYDFVHLPCRYGHENTNIGYGFVNFKDPAYAANFAVAFEGYKFEGFKSTKQCRVKVAAHQGFDGSLQQDVRKKTNRP
jgi:hypothetical protein